MNQNGNEQLFTGEGESKLLSFKEILFKYISNLPLFFFALGAALITAWAYLRWATPVYSVGASMIIKVENAANIKSNDKFSSIFNPIDKINMEDEIELMKSKEFLSRVVDTLHLNNKYIEHGKVRSSEVYQGIPFEAEVINIADSSGYYSFSLQILNEKSFLLNKETKPRPFYSNIELNGSTFRIVPKITNPEFDGGRKFTYTWAPSKAIAGEISGRLMISQKSRNSSVLSFALNTLNPDKGKVILNQIMKEYGDYNVYDKSRISKNSLAFINESLGRLENELGTVEGNLQDFRKRTQFLDMEEQSKMYLEDISATEEELRKQELQLKVIELLDDYIKDKKNIYNLTPTNLGIDDPVLTKLISEYNNLIIRRDNELLNNKETNPVVKEIEFNIEKTRQGIIETLKNIRELYVVSKTELEKKNRVSKGEMFSLPEKESQIREIKRQQAIKNELYNFLLQKREETGIQLSSIVSNAKIFSEAEGGYIPILPKRKNAYMLAIFFGLLIPVIIIFIRDLMNE